MNLLIQKRKAITIPLIIALSIFSIISGPARAAMVDTGEIFKQNQHDLSRTRINAFLDRSEVRNYLAAWGINPDEARSRVNSLTDGEVENIVSRMDHLPAGGDALGAIVGAALLIFIILLITDILGLTDVFSFVKSK